MAQFSYRALRADGSISHGRVEAADEAAALLGLRREGARPISVTAMAPARSGKPRANARSRAASIALVAELAVLLNAGLPLERALALAVGHATDPHFARLFAEMLAEVREGLPLSQAMARRPALFSPAASAMAEAGEAGGQLGQALARLARMLEAAEDLRRMVGNAMIYPVALAVISLGVILLMLLFVIPQFESLFGQQQDALPLASRLVLGASRFVREWGWWLLGGGILAILALQQWMRHPAARRGFDGMVLSLPHLGQLVRHAQIARFSRTLGVLVAGQVALPKALALARRTVSNSVLGAAIEQVADGLRQGGGLAQPLAASGALPDIAIGFLRTGEETSQLGPMLSRLADVLDRDVKLMLERLVRIATPAITILLGASVAAIIASIMSAIIGFNELAIAS